MTGHTQIHPMKNTYKQTNEIGIELQKHPNEKYSLEVAFQGCKQTFNCMYENNHRESYISRLL